MVLTPLNCSKIPAQNSGWDGRGKGAPPHPLQYQWPLEGVGPETHVHKITNVPVFNMVLGLNDFYEGKYISQAIGRGGP